MKNKKLIPKGIYCYDENGKCPYWSINKKYPEQFNGYCSFLNKGDWQLSKEYNKKAQWTTFDGKKIKSKINLPLSLLWDACKECNINIGESR